MSRITIKRMQQPETAREINPGGFFKRPNGRLYQRPWSDEERCWCFEPSKVLGGQVGLFRSYTDDPLTPVSNAEAAAWIAKGGVEQKPKPTPEEVKQSIKIGDCFWIPDDKNLLQRDDDGGFHELVTGYHYAKKYMELSAESITPAGKVTILVENVPDGWKEAQS